MVKEMVVLVLVKDYHTTSRIIVDAINKAVRGGGVDLVVQFRHVVEINDSMFDLVMQ